MGEDLQDTGPIDRILSERAVRNFYKGAGLTPPQTIFCYPSPDALYIDLLAVQTQLSLAAALDKLTGMIAAHKQGANNQSVKSGVLVILDEIQKLPILLDEVHRHVESHKKDRFILTGSSARRLKRAGSNLLGGRAKFLQLSPIVHIERRSMNVPWQRSLQWGGLPSILTSENRKSDLLDYVGIYLQEEIKAEGLTRSLRTFATFLELAASTNGQQVSYQSLSSSVGVSATTIAEYFSILEDTLIGKRLPCYRKSIRRRAVATPKFFLFDVGDGYHPDKQRKLYYWRTQSRVEVDFIVECEDGGLYAIEVKATATINNTDLKGLRKIAEESTLEINQRIVVCNEPHPRMTEDGIAILPVESFLDRLWSHDFF